ncbi:MAG: aquaporin [Gemmataceae bacterium]|nr:aquaporin [Gemmataceae bacterium]
MQANVRVYVTEMIGTAVVVLLTSGAVCVTTLPAFASQPWGARYFIALVAGLSWAVALALTVRISGGFLNPALTITLWVFQRLEHRRAGGLIVAQFLGAAFAGLALRGLFFSNEQILFDSRLGTPHLNRESLSVLAIDRTAVLIGIGIEAVLAFVLTFAVFLFVYDPRFRTRVGGGAYRLAYLWLGILVGLETLLAYDLTGAGLNPARWAGTVIWEGTVDGLVTRGPWQDHGVYWIGPILGSLFAGMVSAYLVLPEGLPPGPPSDGLP